MEIERKYLGCDLASLRATLIELGATHGGCHLEYNSVLDTPCRTLQQENRLLRIRSQRWKNRIRHWLTYKYLPIDPESFKSRHLKAREELELEVGDAGLMKKILGFLGYGEVGCYEKLRQEWELTIGENICKIDLDILPFTKVVELEGEGQLIEQAARSLGLDKCEISINSYGELYAEWCKSQDKPVSHFLLFDKAQKATFLTQIENFKSGNHSV